MTAQRPRKYNNQEDLHELCRSFLQTKDTDKGAAIQYCKDFLSMLGEKPTVTGAVVYTRSKPRSVPSRPPCP